MDPATEPPQPTRSGPDSGASRARERAVVALGSNLGDRYAILCRSLDGLARLAVGRRLVASRLYETDPVGGPPQPAYLNA
ncbi:MAG: 2-amino-4-hydroxy-6-hydroxymethyldihydropteridine diphosphokinase, partial [Proteobacteria bacterium]|nr:2-amino-4-hydroxy-6-hydroxymethyldihydropteridine diphosphokinase [Pseudomonadota bacterium]